MGLTSLKTMKLQWTIGVQLVVILIDSGATHNFISSELVRKMAIPIETTKAYGVLLGTGFVQGAGICKQVTVCLQDIEILEDFLPFYLSSSDIILGIQWLETLGNIQINWKCQRRSFRIQGQKVTLQGDPRLYRSLISLKAMVRAVQVEGRGILVEYGGMELVEATVMESVPASIRAVMESMKLSSKCHKD